MSADRPPRTVSAGLDEPGDQFQQACSYSYTHGISRANLGIRTKVAYSIRPFPIMIYKIHSAPAVILPLRPE